MKSDPVLTPGDIPYRFGEAWNRYDAAGIADLFFEDADFVNVVGKWWDNKEDIRRAHDYGLRVIFPNSHLKVLNTKEKMLKDDIAVVHARISVTGQRKEKVESAGVRETMFIFVARKVKGEWLCESAQNTDIVYGMQTNIRDEKGELKPVDYRKRKKSITRDLNEEQKKGG